MAWTTAEEKRIQAIETAINQLQTAVSNLMSKQQMRQLLLLRQEEIDTMKERITALETQVATLQGQLG
jgi:polyhydroxyalkanoate synthesis regulator phasin